MNVHNEDGRPEVCEAKWSRDCSDESGSLTSRVEYCILELRHSDFSYWVLLVVFLLLLLLQHMACLTAKHKIKVAKALVRQALALLAVFVTYTTAVSSFANIDDVDPEHQLSCCLPRGINKYDDVKKMGEMQAAIIAFFLIMRGSGVFGTLFMRNWKTSGFSNRVLFSLNILHAMPQELPETTRRRRSLRVAKLDRATTRGSVKADEDHKDDEDEGITKRMIFRMRTLLDKDIKELYPDEGVVSTLIKDARFACDTGAVEHPFMCLQPEERDFSILSNILHVTFSLCYDFALVVPPLLLMLLSPKLYKDRAQKQETATLRRLRDQLRNAISANFAQDFIYDAFSCEDMTVKSAEFVFGLTFERRYPAMERINKKYRCLLIRKDHLETISKLRVIHGTDDWVNQISLEAKDDSTAQSYAKDRLRNLGHLFDLQQEIATGMDERRALVGALQIAMPFKLLEGSLGMRSQ